MLRPYVRYALTRTKKALKECNMPANRDNVLKVLVDYYGLSPKEIEEIKI